VHDVRMRETADGDIVNFHCRVDPALSVHDVHEKVDELERGLRQNFPTIKRVIGHAEPGPGLLDGLTPHVMRGKPIISPDGFRPGRARPSTHPTLSHNLTRSYFALLMV
jgi:hypothetical protein